MPEFLLERTDGAVTEVRLNRADARNALSRQVMAELDAAISRIGADAGTHVIILAANGPAFSGGHDLKEITAARTEDDGGRAFYEDTMADCARLMQRIVTCPKPVIASVQGIATAAGCQLVASCDLAVASDAAKFATPGVNIGLFCSTPMVALSRNVSRKKAMEMLLTGDLIPADAACDMGLVNRVVRADALDAATWELAQQIASKAPKTLKIGKEAFYHQIERPLAEAYDYAARVMVENLMNADAREGIGAFVEKRQPNWEMLDQTRKDR